MKKKLVSNKVQFSSIGLWVILVLTIFGLSIWVLFSVFHENTVRMPRAEYATYSPDGRIIAMVVYQYPELNVSVALRNADNGDLITNLSDWNELILAPVFSDNGQMIAVSDYETIEFWDTETGSLIREVDLNNWVTGVGYASDENVWIVNIDGSNGVETFSIDATNDFAIQEIASFTDWQGGRLFLR